MIPKPPAPWRAIVLRRPIASFAAARGRRAPAPHPLN